LQHSSSAYLAQHADNPVDWWEWSEEAFAVARELDKPIFLSVGYAACHWCHVMAHESFEDPEIARLLNDNFIPIKVDREERPDVDSIYMAATQLMSGHGGWPMSVFMTPEMKPFLAGTYFPPVDRGGQPGFTRVVTALGEAWASERARIEEQAEELAKAIRQEVSFIDRLSPPADSLDFVEIRSKLTEQLVERFHRGGFSVAPKFPRTSFVNALLENEDARSLELARESLKAMSHGGLYDHIDGGFARYSVDEFWAVPHFEKMLCDQAQLATLYFRASKRLHSEEFKAVGITTLDYVLRTMRVSNGFASSLDADAAGVEGSHITWTKSEVAEVLDALGNADQLDAVCERWQISDGGNLEGRSVPRLLDEAPFATPIELASIAEALRLSRLDRPQPGRDEKVILEWNAMLALAFLVSTEERHHQAGLALLEGLFSSHFSNGWWRTEAHSAHATLADLAWLLDACVSAFELTGDDAWLHKSQEIAQFVKVHFVDRETSGQLRGYFSQDDAVQDLPTRTKDLFDGAVPAAHSVWTRALARLGLVLGDADLMAEARVMVQLAGTVVRDYPLEVVDLINAAGYAFEGLEIVVPGDENSLSAHLRLTPMIRSVLVAGTGSSPLLAGREPHMAYVCRNGVCQLPVDNWADLDSQIAELLYP
jgi:uncharacterized protein YyaL (SSP411 family)